MTPADPANPDRPLTPVEFRHLTDLQRVTASTLMFRRMPWSEYWQPVRRNMIGLRASAFPSYWLCDREPG